MPNLRYRASAPTYVDGDLADGLTDSAGRQIVVTAGGTASGSTASGNPSRIAGVARPVANKQTRTNGQVSDITTDENENQWVRESYAPGAEDNTNNVIGIVRKPVLASTYSGTAFVSFGSSVAISAKATPGILRSIYASNENAAVRYLQIHNKASAPGAADVPVFSFPIPAGTANNPGTVQITEGWLENYYFTTGVAVGISTAKGSHTAATASEHTVNGQVF